MSYTLYPLQLDGLARTISLNGQIVYMMDPRTGKSVITLEYLLNHEKVDRIQILCPEIAVPVWKFFVPQFTDYPMYVMRGRSLQESADRLRRIKPDKGVIIAPLASAWMEPLRSTISGFRAPAHVVDEAQKIKGPHTKQGIFAREATATFAKDKKPHGRDPGHRAGDRVMPWVDYRLALTGTPIDKYLENLWGIYAFVDPNILGNNYPAYESRHVVRNEWTHAVKEYRDVEFIQQQVDAHTYKCSYTDMYGEPNVADFKIPVTLTGESRRVHTALRKEAYAMVTGSSDTQDGYVGPVLAECIFSEIMKCQEVTSGFVKLDDGTLVDIGSDKIKVCIDLVKGFREMRQNVIIFCRFKRDIARLAKLLNVDINDTLCGLANGNAQDRTVTDLQNQAFFDRCPILIAQIQAASMSADMGGAHNVIFFSTDYSYINFSQAYMRPLGPNQDGRVDYYHLIAESPDGPTIDEDVYEALHTGQDVVRLICKLDYATRIFATNQRPPAEVG